MLVFRRNKKSRNKNKKAIDSSQPARNDTAGKETLKMRNDAITVRLVNLEDPVVDTAIASHIGTREYQQDAAYVCDASFKQEPDVVFGVLCDGMGGQQQGERISGETVAFVANKINDYDGTEDWPVFLEQTAYAANELALENNQKAGTDSGTTLIAAVLDKDRLFWLNLGDSRIYIVRENEMVLVTRDHNFALELQQQVDAGVLTQEQADNDPRKEMLISYIGAPILEITDVNRSGVQLRKKDLVLLCSDGLTKILEEEDMLRIIQAHRGPLQALAETLVLVAFNRSPASMDNTTVILMQYLGDAQ